MTTSVEDYSPSGPLRRELDHMSLVLGHPRIDGQDLRFGCGPVDGLPPRGGRGMRLLGDDALAVPGVQLCTGVAREGRYCGCMQIYPVAMPFPAGADAPNFPGRTPTTAHASLAPATGMEQAIRRPARVAAVGAAAPTAAPGQHWALEWLEDAFLLLLIVFALPVVILLLGVPFAVILRVAAMLGAR